jgi:TPR repeat protein
LESLFELSKNMLIGNGLDKDVENAERILVEISKKGNKESLFYLGECYEQGVGFEKNFKKAVWYFQKAAENGNEKALSKISSEL